MALDRVPPVDRVTTPASSPGYPAEPSPTWPSRTPGSVRRTSRIISTWPGEPDGPLEVSGRARDVFTTSSGGPELLAESSIEVVFSADRVIERVTVRPDLAEPGRLVGSGPGRGFRRAIAAAFPDEADRSSLAYFLVEDLTTTPLLSTFALSRRPETQELFVALSSGPVSAMEDVCAGYRRDGLAMQLRRKNEQRSQNVAVTERDPDDDAEAAWYPADPPTGLGMCRRRRIDLTPDDGGFLISAGFRDHTWEPDGREAIVHEYELDAVLSPGEDGLVLASVTARPRVIPYPDCPAAADEVARLVGSPLPTLRTRVLEELRGVESCTHLNDMVRALAELGDLTDEWPQEAS
ncbi:MAG: DUF2889 domain-containing protein [Actinomycetota bacterium]